MQHTRGEVALKGLRLTVVVGAIAATVVAGACSSPKGHQGKSGPVGPTAQPPVIESMSFPALTRNLIATIYGGNFTAVVGGSSGAPSVWATATRPTCSRPTRPRSPSRTVSRPGSRTRRATGTSRSSRTTSCRTRTRSTSTTPATITRSIRLRAADRRITATATGGLIAVDVNSGWVDRIDATGTLTNVPLPLQTNAPLKAWDDGSAGLWVLDSAGHLDHQNADGTSVRVANIPGGPSDGAWDTAATPNFYAVTSSSGHSIVVKIDGTTHAMTIRSPRRTTPAPPLRPARNHPDGRPLYLTDLTNGAIVAVNLGTQASTVYAANGSLTGPQRLTNDGTNLFVYSGGNLTQVDGTGTVTQSSTLHGDDSGAVSGLAADAAGHLFAATSPYYCSTGGHNYIARWSAAGSTIEPWAGDNRGWALGYFNGRLFDGSMAPATCGSADVTTGILYEYKPDGSLRRVTGQLKNFSSSIPVYGDPALIGGLTFHGGKLWTVSADDGSIELDRPGYRRGHRLLRQRGRRPRHADRDCLRRHRKRLRRAL